MNTSDPFAKWRKGGAAAAFILCIILSVPHHLSAEEPAASSDQPATSPVLPPGPDIKAEAFISKGQTLNMNQCIDIALRLNTAIMRATGNVNIEQGKVGQERSDYYPKVNAFAAYTRNNSPDWIVNPFTNEFESRKTNRYNQYAGGVELEQNILNPRTWSRVNSAKQRLAASRQDLVDIENEVVLNVKKAYYQVLQTKRNRDMRADVIKGYQLHLDQAKGFYDVGTKAKADVIKAEVDLSNAKLELIKAENDYKVAWLRLNTLMGVPDVPEYTIEDTLFYQPYLLTLEEATTKAFENRPDLKAAAAKRQAAESAIGAARAGHYPILSGKASYSKGGFDRSTSKWEEEWQAGLTLTIPLFNGFLTSHQVAEAKATYYFAKSDEEGERQTVLFEVREAYLALRAAEASISTAELAASQAKENLDLENGKYAAGVGSPVEVSDAFEQYVKSQGRHTDALAIYKAAQATIENAMGLR
jgi:outer membrane protein